MTVRGFDDLDYEMLKGKLAIYVDLLDQIASDLAFEQEANYRLRKETEQLVSNAVNCESRVTDQLAQLEQREQEVADLTAQLSQAKHGVQWHPASEQPERWPVLVDFMAVKEYGHIYATYYGFIPQSTVRWCYIDEVK